MYTGPNTVNDGLLFGYDTGYGIADNDTATRFYPGQPAVNLFGDISNANARPNRTEYNTSNWTANFPKPPEDVGRVYSHTSGSLNSTWSGNSYGYTLINYSFLANTSYTLSCWVFVSADSNIDALHQSMEGTTLTNTTNRYYNLNNKGTWQQLSISCNSSSAVGGNAIIAYPRKNGVTNGSHTGFWAIGGAKLEINTHVTPYVLGTRSNTASLIDLKRTTGVDVSNVSFDSTGQPTFDGTDDYIDVTTNFGTLAQYSFEWVENPNATHKMPISTRQNVAFYKYGAYSWRYTHGGTAGELYHTAGATSGWHHWAVTYDGSTLKIFQDNIILGTRSVTGTADFSQGLKIGWWSSGGDYAFDGDIPVMKFYNKALTADEVARNFNAYKNRFNI